MKTVKIDFTKETGVIKPMHAAGGGPARSVRGCDYFEDYKEAGIPYARNHDAAFVDTYGGAHTVDVLNIFPDFSKDENDPVNYDFILTDQLCQWWNEAGAAVFYRLGSKIEHQKVKYQTQVPSDFGKYARICEHIIRHLCYGWADGLHLDIPYFEIWNEPDCMNFDGTNPCWQGTPEQFREFFKVMAVHLKKCFPDKKIGGPAFTHILDFPGAVEFIEYCEKNRIPMDFFSWHGYETDPRRYGEAARYTRKLLDDHGYQNAELILNEWNYVCGWLGDDMLESYETIANEKGAAFVSAGMLDAQKSPMDIFMYYELSLDSTYNGAFDPVTLRKRKPYYAFWDFNQLYRLKTELYSETEAPLYVGAAGNPSEAAIQLAYYQDKDLSEDMAELVLSGAKEGAVAEIYLVGGEHSQRIVRKEILGKNTTLYLPLKPYDVYLILIKG